MRAVIIGNGSISNIDSIRLKIKNDDYIICADGGYNIAKRMGIKPDILIGDLDSISELDEDIKTIQYPSKKDVTDGELCLNYAIEKGFDDILLLCMTSTRLDHTINNILMLSRCNSAVIADEKNEIYILKDVLKIENRKGKTLSILPIKGDLEGIITEGLMYPLCDETLYFGECRGNSNVILDDALKITVKKGMGIVVITDGE